MKDQINHIKNRVDLYQTLYLSHLLSDCFQITYLDYFYRTPAQVQIWAFSKMATICQFALVDTLNLVIYYPISSKFHIWTTFIKLLFMSEYAFCQMNDNQDCRQNEYPLFTARHYGGSFVGVRLFSFQMKIMEFEET